MTDSEWNQGIPGGEPPVPEEIQPPEPEKPEEPAASEDNKPQEQTGVPEPYHWPEEPAAPLVEQENREVQEDLTGNVPGINLEKEPVPQADAYHDISSGNPIPEEPTQREEPPAPVGNPYQQYSQYGPYGQPYQPVQPPQPPYGGQPYQNPQTPYQYQSQPPYQYWNYQQTGPQPGGVPPQPPQIPQQPEEPHRMSGGLKVFLWILGILAGLFLLSFCVVSINTAIRQIENPGQAQSSPPSASAPAPEGEQSPDNGAQEEQPPVDATDPNNSGMIIEPRPDGAELTAKEVYQDVVASVVGVETTQDDGTGLVSQGSGIVATRSGYIITNAHVVEYSRDSKVSVILHNDETKYDAIVVGYDKSSDLAILKIDARGLHPAVFGDADALEIGDQVLAIGNPGGLNFASTLTGGYVSALDRKLSSSASDTMTYIQTDAAINPGNSGGPLVNMYGQVVGINSNKIIAQGYEGMGFAIPVSHAKAIIDDLIKNGYVSGRSRLGITAKNVTAEEMALSKLPAGVRIIAFDEESSFGGTDAAEGDIIIKADGDTISTMNDLYVVLNRHKAGDEIVVTLYSPRANNGNGGEHDVTIRLLEDKGETQKTVSQPEN